MAITKIQGIAPPVPARTSAVSMPVAPATVQTSFAERLTAAHNKSRTDTAPARPSASPSRTTDGATTIQASAPKTQASAMRQAQSNRTTELRIAPDRTLPAAQRQRRKALRRHKRRTDMVAALAQVASVFGALADIVLDEDSGTISVVLKEQGGATLTLGMQDGGWLLDIAGDDGVLCDREDLLKARFAQENLGPIDLY